MTKLKTATEVRAWFDEQGISISEWARNHGYGRSLVQAIVEGKKACMRGQSHQVAVLLGMKRGVITRSPDAARQRGPHTLRAAAAGQAATPGQAK